MTHLKVTQGPKNSRFSGEYPSILAQNLKKSYLLILATLVFYYIGSKEYILKDETCLFNCVQSGFGFFTFGAQDCFVLSPLGQHGGSKLVLVVLISKVRDSREVLMSSSPLSHTTFRRLCISPKCRAIKRLCIEKCRFVAWIHVW